MESYRESNKRNRPRTVVLYGRVSTDHEQQISALRNQMDWYENLAKHNPNWRVVAQYIDEGITGTQIKKRPSFMQMMEHAREHRFDLIVTRELSRFARNTVDALNSIRELKLYGVEVYFVNDGIWTMDGDGEVRLTIMASIAQDESRKISERVKAGQKISQAKGVLYGNGNIIGYDRVGDTYVINEEQAATVRRIYELYAEGKGKTVVANILMPEERKDGGEGCVWTSSKVSKVLRKPTYKGYITYNKSHVADFLNHNRVNHDEQDYILVKENFEPIVSEELWATCNEIRRKRAVYVKDNEGRAHRFGVSFPMNKWTKILFCDCGARIQVEGIDKAKNGKTNMRFICSETKKIIKNKENTFGIPCPNPYASEWKLELMAREVFNAVWEMRSQEVIKAVRAVNDCLDKGRCPCDVEELKNQRDDLCSELDALAQDLALKKIAADEFVRRRDEIDAQIAEKGKAIAEKYMRGSRVMKFDTEKSRRFCAIRLVIWMGRLMRMR